MSAQVSTNHHLHLKRLAFITYRCVWSRCIDQPVRTDIPSSIQHVFGELVQHLTLVRDRPRQDHIKGGYSVGCYHHEEAIIDRINISHFALVKCRLVRETELVHK